jgi:hypothetical protein
MFNDNTKLIRQSLRKTYYPHFLPRRSVRLVCLVTFLLLCVPLLHSDADRQDWIGEFAMNHDGHTGTLSISASKRKCIRLPCPGLDVQYTDQNGASYPGSVDVLDDGGQHMEFTVEFPGNPQVFQVYIFSFDKTKLAGTTVWQGRTFGVFAERAGGSTSPAFGGPLRKQEATVAPSALRRRAAVRAGVSTGTIPGPTSTPSGTPNRTITSDGVVELRYPDGMVRSRKIGACAWDTRYPDGRFVPAQCLRATVIPIVPPTPPSGSTEEHWLQGQDENLLGILQKILGGPNSSDFQNYLQAYENPKEQSIYKRIYFRTNAILDLSYTPQ